jgi:hypothetical protein
MWSACLNAGTFAMAPPDCQLCEDTAATLHCKQCQENFCQEVRDSLPCSACVFSPRKCSAARTSASLILCAPQCFEALHYSGKRQGHEVTPVQQSVQSSPVKPQPPASAPIGELSCRRGARGHDLRSGRATYSS